MSVEREMRQAGIGPDRYRLIYHGIDADAYHAASLDYPRENIDGKLRVAFVGSLLPQKGVHTAIEALSHLARRGDDTEITLDILGVGHPQYEDRLHRMVIENCLAGRVAFHQPIPRGELPAFLARHDVLVLPSTWEEHLALISEEAMAAGLVLVGTLTGGTPEILSDGVNGLAFGRENAEELADQLVCLAHDVSLRQRLSAAAWQTIQERFTISGMLDEMETWLEEIAA
jgi:glycosyltransferase involved in cell wall biosynthesis